MGKFLVRLTLVFVAIYFLSAFLIAQYLGIDILLDFHIVPFELVTVVYCYSEGKYHCRYMKYTALSILLSDTLSRIDNHLDFLTVSAHNLIPIGILALGVGTSITLAIRHFIQVTRLKNARKTISNKKSGISHS
jgi:hypothetical protein